MVEFGENLGQMILKREQLVETCMSVYILSSGLNVFMQGVVVEPVM